MKKVILISSAAALALISSVLWLTRQDTRQTYAEFLRSHPYHIENSRVPDPRKIPKRDRPDLAWQQDYLRTMDPALKRPAPERLDAARGQMQDYFRQMAASRTGTQEFPWVERGPANVGGRTRAIMWDPSDNTGKKVWAGGVTGGLWFTTDIYNSNTQWQKVNDFWENISITAMAADPNNPQVFYVGTGEGFGTGSSRGGGVWKSSDAGATWTRLSASTEFYYVNDLIVRNESGTSALYVGVRGNYYQGQWFGDNGLYRSTNGGTAFSQVMPDVSGGDDIYSVADLELDANNNLWAASQSNSFGDGGGTILFSSNGTNWTIKTTRANASRVEIACAPSNANVVYALVEVDGQVGEVLKTTNAGTNWTVINKPVDADEGISADDFSRGQAWYDLILAVDPNNSDVVFAGAIDLFKSTNGGTEWLQISHWWGNGFPYVHADQHAIVFKPGSSSDVVFGHDGGIDLSITANQAEPSFINRNNNYNVTQFYATAIHPNAGSNYFLAGSQDNGTQRFGQAGLGATTEATGGDGGYCFIDQTNPNVQITAYVYNQFWIVTNGGQFPNNFSISDENTGQFINPADYDNNLGILYTAVNSSKVGRFRNIRNGNPQRADINITMDDIASHLRVSPYSTTSTTLFVGSGAGELYKITNADLASPTITDITGVNFPSGNISCVEIGENENHLLVTFSNYGVTSVWVSTNGGSNWAAKEGNLPDMPVRWALFNPNNYKEAILATELGVWRTEDITVSSPNWVPSNIGLANVRVDMLQIRDSDDEVIAATFGRGLYSSSGFSSGNMTPTLTANFSSSVAQVEEGNSVTFTDQSTGGAVAWEWTFEGGTPATSTDQNPTVSYATRGQFDVSLKVTDDEGNTNTKSVPDFITATGPLRPNLVAYHPSGWSGEITIYTVAGEYELSQELTALFEEVYMAHGAANVGDKAIEVSFDVQIWLDDELIITNPWDFSAAEPMEAGDGYLIWNIEVGAVAEGDHTLKVVLDSENVIEESDEEDNEFELSFYVQASCAGEQQLTALTGTVSDGSGPSDYMNNLLCDWVIAPERAVSITLSFEEFELETEDFLYIYDSESATTPIEALTGNDLPDEITVESGVVRLEFDTDESERRGGWRLTYTTEEIPLGLVARVQVQVYPNPASERVTVTSSASQQQSYQIADIGGRIVRTGTFVVSTEVDVCEFKPGIYLITIGEGSSKTTSRFVVKN